MLEGEFDIKGAGDRSFTHCFHTYPATMIPEVPRKLIQTYAPRDAERLLDPFCGSGTVLVEARLHGLDCTGFDVNPLAREISDLKTRNYDINRISKFLQRFQVELERAKENPVSLDDCINRSGFPEEIISKWFTDDSIIEIGTVLDCIERVDGSELYKRFARLALSGCIRSVSFQRNNENKLYRMGIEDQSQHKPHLYSMYEEKLRENLDGLSEFQSILSAEGFGGTNAAIREVDVVNMDLRKRGRTDYDIVVTSPPYGDSRTTVAYSEYSWLANTWLGLDRRPAGRLAKEMMGGRVSEKLGETGFGKLDGLLLEISESGDDRRAREVYSFYADYKKSILKISDMVNEGGFVCFVVGNRTVKGRVLPTDEFTRWCFETYGFDYIGTEVRVIRNKRLPSVISPSGKKGDTVQTMNAEYIVICKKPVNVE